MERRAHGTGTAWEPRVGYSRAVRVGPFVSVAGTTGLGPDGNVVPGGMYAQSKRAIEICAAALAEAGASLADVVRTRLFVTDITQWQEVARAHGEAFATIRPATAMLQVAALIDPAMLVEIEMDAVIAA